MYIHAQNVYGSSGAPCGPLVYTYAASEVTYPSSPVYEARRRDGDGDDGVDHCHAPTRRRSIVFSTIRSVGSQFDQFLKI